MNEEEEINKQKKQIQEQQKNKVIVKSIRTRMIRSEKTAVQQVEQKKEEDPEKLATLKYLGDLDELAAIAEEEAHGRHH